MRKHWWQETVVYQIYPRSFQDSNNDGIGDLRGIIQRLDYIKELGIDVIWLSPIYQSPNDDNGYDISNYQQIMTDFGTMTDLKNLLKEIHIRGMKLMMDLVVNHTSDEHPWFVEAKSSQHSKYHDYYIWRKNQNNKIPNNWRSNFSGSAWQYVPELDEYYLHIFTKKQVDLNWNNSAMRQDIYNMMTWWCDKGIDGFRMDVINLISKPDDLPNDPLLEKSPSRSSLHMTANGPHVHEFLKEMNQAVLSNYNLITVGETPGASTIDAIQYTGFDRAELQMVFQFEHMSIDNDSEYGNMSTNKFNLVDLKKVMSKWQIDLNGRAWNSLYWNNHDQARVISRFGDDTQAYRVLSGKMLANCLHMMQGTPYIYQGEELGMTNIKSLQISDYRDVATLNAYHELVEIKKVLSASNMMARIHARSRDNARTPMQWDETDTTGFTNGTPWIAINPNHTWINVKQALADKNSLYYFYKKLIELRHKHLIIVYGDYSLIDPLDNQVYAFWRQYNGQKLLVINNFTKSTLNRPIMHWLHNVKIKPLISNYAIDTGDVLRPYETRTYLI
ncbi:alpha-glucosidase [Loigolactobacillus coryniformis]|uniref:glycoside hydrolase family 13 protein n=1 Tax=Loigolactobacillus coryniformis TaxID=1610 RepID=UPI002340403D|nr:alpha-glucosidase [Loigolactobacillus coryniformis]MDC4186476.1 alpha-glucosidase [Loigolactobacillus coryniformis]